MQQTVALAEKDARRIRTLQAEVQACLALSRATLQAVAAMSPVVSAAADVALEEEAVRQAIPDRTLEIIEQVRLDLHCSSAEARLARMLERALIDAADAVPEDADLADAPIRRRA